MANQTVNLPSKMLMARLVSCRVVLWALATHGPRLVEIFNGPFGRSLPDTLCAYLEGHVLKLREVLIAARDLLITSDRRLRDQKAVTTRFRRLRDAAFKALSPYMVGVRDTFKGACGVEVTAEIGFALRTPEQPAVLHEQAVHLVDRLSAPHLDLPAVRFRGVALDPPALVEEMRPLVVRLGETLEDVGREERLTDAMKIAKDEALTAYDLTFGWVARSAETLFRLANLPEIAKRVRPSSRRPGVTDEVESQGPEFEDPEAAGEVIGEVADEAPEASSETSSDAPSTAQ